MRWYTLGSNGKKPRNLVGNKYGRLTVKSRAESNTRRTKWLCLCDCGNEKVVSGENLMSGHTKSCGCLLREAITSHGMSHDKLYKRWSSMKARCNNPNNPAYKNYGGRGIQVCKEWEESFDSFYRDMIEGYEDGLELDRVNNDEGYSKENCRWVTHKENNRNKRTNRVIDGINLAEYCEEHGINENRVISRITKCGWDEREALYTPKQRGRYDVHFSS